MDLSYKQEVTVGGLVLLAIALFILGTTWLSGRSIGGDSGKYWHMQFKDVAGLKASSAVRVSGVQVGRVEEILLVNAGNVVVAVSLDKGIVPKVDAKAQVVAIGFVGDAVINLDPGQASEPLPKNRTIVGSQATGLTDRAEQLSHRADSVLIGLQTIVNQRTADDLHNTLQALQGTLKIAQRTMDLYGNPKQGPTAALTDAITTFKQLGSRLDSTFANPALTRALNRSDTLAQHLAAMTAQFTSTGARLDSTLAALNRGQGTLGKFATDSSLFYDLRNFTQSANRFMEDLRKHPGKISPTIKFCC